MGRKATGKCVRPVMVNLPADLGEWVMSEADRKKCSMTSIIIAALEHHRGPKKLERHYVPPTITTPDDRLYNQFMDIYITCGGHSGHSDIARKLGTAPEKLQQYIARELPVSQKQIDAISRIME